MNDDVTLSDKTDATDATEDTSEALDKAPSTELPLYRILEGTSPALEFECAPHSHITAAKGAFLAKSPKISVSRSPHDEGLDLYENNSDETEILYLSPSSAGSLIAFDMTLHRKGLLVSAASLFALTQQIDLTMLLDIELAGIDGPYRVYKVTGDGVIVAFMSGDLFPISLDDEEDALQIDARALAAMEPSISFELEQLSNGQYVASLHGPGRVWLQSMPTQ